MKRQPQWGKKMGISLAFKLACYLVLSTSAFFAVAGYLNQRLQRQQSEQIVLEWAHRTSDLIQRSTRYQMLRNDRQALYETIRAIASEPGVRRIRIFSELGRITFSTDPEEVGRLVDKRAEACYGCHVQEAPLSKLDRPDRSRIFTDSQGQRILGLIQPIENEAACSNAACHTHPPDRRILGVIDTDLSLAAADAQLAEHQNQLLGFTSLAVILICLVSATFVWAVVHKPVKELIQGTQKVAGGELDYRLPVRTRDELGELATSFNRMTADLGRAHSQVTNWAHTLEQRVQEKTEELQRIYRTLMSSEQMASLGKLAAVVAHEVNNPLFGILTYARLIRKAVGKSDLSSEEKIELIDQIHTIERESRRCGDMMRNLLTFARQAPSCHQEQDLNVLVERALTLVHHQLELQGIELEKKLAQAMPRVSCDGSQVQQAVLSLLINAAEAMPNGGRLEVSTAVDPHMREASIRVRDNGGGIPAETLPHIFEPFFTTKEEPQRTGLGLAVARSIVEQHGGSISVDSRVRDYSEFLVRLPIETPPEPTPAVSADRQRK